MSDSPTDDDLARKQAEERLRAALDSVGDGSWDWNIRSGEMYLSDRWYEAIGYKRGELASGSDFWRELVHRDDTPNIDSAIEAHLRGHTRAFECEYRILSKSGEHRWMLARGRVLEHDEDGKPLRMVGTNADISLAKRVQLSLDELEGRCRSIVNTAGCIIVVIDRDGRIQEWNPAAERIYGWSLEAVRGRNYAEWFLPEEYREPVGREVERILEGGADTRNFENPIISRDGNLHDVLWNATALRNSEGVAWAVVAIGQDITEWRRAERQHEIALDEKDRALARARMLSVALERCSSCSSVRTRDGAWHDLESHLRIQAADALCPRCAAS